jgi:hypothetical protein
LAAISAAITIPATKAPAERVRSTSTTASRIKTTRLIKNTCAAMGLNAE